MHQENNRGPFIYETADFGKRWTAITKGIPHSMPSYTHCVREDQVAYDELKEKTATYRQRLRCYWAKRWLILMHCYGRGMFRT
jgi:hypothetical protein